MYTREAFNARLDGARRMADRHARVLAAVAITGGLGQLALLRWLESGFDARVRKAIAFGIFLIYIAIVTVLIVRRERASRAASPTCPQCGALLKEMSARVAVATGNCDACGGRVIEA